MALHLISKEKKKPKKKNKTKRTYSIIKRFFFFFVGLGKKNPANIFPAKQTEPVQKEWKEKNKNSEFKAADTNRRSLNH